MLCGDSSSGSSRVTHLHGTGCTSSPNCFETVRVGTRAPVRVSVRVCVAVCVVAERARAHTHTHTRARARAVENIFSRLKSRAEGSNLDAATFGDKIARRVSCGCSVGDW